MSDQKWADTKRSISQSGTQLTTRVVAQMKGNFKRNSVLEGSRILTVQCGEINPCLSESGIVGAFECRRRKAAKCQRRYDGGPFDRCSEDAAVEGS